MNTLQGLRACAGFLLAAACAWAGAQTPPAAPASAPASAASAPASASAAAPGRAAAASAAPAPARAASAAGQQVDVIGSRESDMDQRRRSTAAKIVIGRQDIEKFGDATLGEVLRRLPGVTTPGAPGRGGAPRMRGLGGGYTQLLIDGQRVPPGFSLESLSPEQVERIEILRAPTAETGARAIAGTINIILREGFTRRLNELRVGLSSENGRVGGGGFWSRNDTVGALTYTLSAALFGGRRASTSRGDVEVTDEATGALLEQRHTDRFEDGERVNLHLNARLQWRLSERGDVLVLMPGLFANDVRGHSSFRQAELLPRRSGAPEYADHGDGASTSHFEAPRLGWQYRQTLGAWRVESGGNLGASRSRGDSRSQDLRADDSLIREQSEASTSRENSLRLNVKGSRALGGDGDGAGREHSLVVGAEIEGSRRRDTRATVPDVPGFDDDVQASVLRRALFAQDEWSLDAHWALHAGLRWEGITTRGDDGQGGHPRNEAAVTTPLVHVLWKPDPGRRDQVRLSLTRSWRAPATGALIGRPSINRLNDPLLRTNERTSPDSAGNPDLRPELSNGIDIAFERYLGGGGVLSANVFHRRISQLMRAGVELESVPWSPFPRWVRRTRNIGSATTRGIELESKFRLDQAWEGAVPVELRANVAFYDSRVDGVPGPDNRLDQQARATGNLGADYRLRGMPLTLGGNLNWVPATTVRLDEDQRTRTSTKRQWDLFALWTFSPTVGLRVLANNVLPLDYETETWTDATSSLSNRRERTHGVSGGRSDTNWQLRLELRL